MIYIGILQSEDIIGADKACFQKLNTAVAKQDVLSTTLVIDAVQA